MNLQTRCCITLAALVLFSGISSAQNNKPLESAKSNGQSAPAVSPATGPLSHDLSGVWMQYPDGDVPGVPGKEGSPHLRCDPEGPPMLLVLPNPFEIVQTPGRVFMFFEEQHIWRTIWTDGRPLPKDPDPSWLGYSVGHWEGDTLVVDTVGFNDKLWADPLGDPRSEQMHLTERYRRLDHDTLELQIIIDDPKSYTKVWVNPPKRHKLEATWEIAEWFCVRGEEDTYDEAVRKPAGVAPASK